MPSGLEDSPFVKVRPQNHRPQGHRPKDHLSVNYRLSRSYVPKVMRPKGQSS